MRTSAQAYAANITAAGRPIGMVPRGDFKNAASFKGLQSLITRKGGKSLAILRRFGFSPAQLDDEKSYISYSSMIRLMEYCAETLAAPSFGFELAVDQPADVTGPLAMLLLASPTVNDGLTLVSRYFAILAPGSRLSIDIRNGEACLSYIVHERSVTFSRQVNEFSLVLALKSLRMIAGPTFCLTSAGVASAPPSHRDPAVDAFFGVPVHYDQPISNLRFAERFLKCQIDTSNPQLLRIAQAQCDALVPQDLQLTELVANQVRQLLPMGGCSLDMVARQLSVHPRSLQNRLTEAGVEFREIVRTQRLALAQAYLTDTRTPIAEVATLLGYSNQAAFTRAFSTWQGQSPGRYRHATRQSSDALRFIKPELVV